MNQSVTSSRSLLPRPLVQALPARLLAPRSRGRLDHCLRELGVGEQSSLGGARGRPAPQGLGASSPVPLIGLRRGSTRNSSPWRLWALILALVPILATSALAAPQWSTVTLSTAITPLENRVAALGPGWDEPDLLVFSLWSTGVNRNHLGAFRVPHPYDGTGVSFTQDIDVGALFGVGSICVLDEGHAIVPYVRQTGGNFGIFVAELFGGGWTLQAIADTITPDFQAVDCFLTSTDVWLMTHNVDNQSLDLYRRDLPTESGPGGVFSFNSQIGSGTLGGPPVAPLEGTFASPLRVASGVERFGTYAGFRFTYGVNIRAGVDIESHFGWTDTLDPPGNVEPRTESYGRYEMPVSRGPFLERSAPTTWPIPGESEPAPQGPTSTMDAYAAIQNNGMLSLLRLSSAGGPDLDVEVPLGAITSPGTLFDFQGADVATGPDGMIYVVADKAYQVDPETLVSTQLIGYPFEDRGGPANLAFPPGMPMGFAVGPGSQELALIDLGIIFQNGFETGDTTAWDVVSP